MVKKMTVFNGITPLQFSVNQSKLFLIRLNGGLLFYNL